MTDLALAYADASGGGYLSSGFSVSARSVAGWLATATLYARANASDWRTLLVTRIRSIHEQYCEEGWDGYNAQPVSAAVARNAIQFATSLPVYLPAPTLTPESDGEISFDWWFGPKAQFSVSVGPSGTLTYAGLIGSGVKRHGVEPLRRYVPPYILGTIEELVAKSCP